MAQEIKFVGLNSMQQALVKGLLLGEAQGLAEGSYLVRRYGGLKYTVRRRGDAFVVSVETKKKTQKKNKKKKAAKNK